MKKNKFNILFIDKKVASKNFACYFLDNCKLFLLLDKKQKEETEIFSSFNFEEKTKIKFDSIFIFSPIEYKQLEYLNVCLKPNAQILTNNFQAYSILKNNNFDVVYISLDLDNDFNKEQQIILYANNDYGLDNFAPKITIKEKSDILNIELANIVLNNAILSELYLCGNKTKALLYKPKSQKHIINLIKEQVELTNSCLLTLDILKFNFYTFLSSSNVVKHLKLFMFLSNLKKQQLNTQELKNNIEKILQLNYNKYVNIKYLNKIFEMLS